MTRMLDNPRPLPREVLDIANKTRSNLFAWRGQFSPQLVEALISTYAPAGALILDPFVGSGTVLHEAGRLGFRAVGSEINPAAVAFARIYEFVNLPVEKRRVLLRRMNGKLGQIVTGDLPLLRAERAAGPRENALEQLLELVSSNTSAACRRVLEALVTSLDVHRNKPDAALVRAKWAALKGLILSLPFSTAELRASVSDARRLPIPDSAVDFVITSPPYINVFNYHQQYRASAELLGADLLHVAQSEIGSNRKHRQNRFLTVVQYCLDMSQVLAELRRVCRERAQLVFVVGRESNVRKTPFFNSDIIQTLATDCIGMTCLLRQERVFTNRFGQRICEDILHLINTEDGREPPLATPRRIAFHALKSALDRAPADALPGLKEAMAAAETVRESPILREPEAPLAVSPPRT